MKCVIYKYTYVTFLSSGNDLENTHKSLGISTIDFKYTAGSENGVLVIENTFTQKGSPVKHLHYDQDEWFYAAHGTFVIEVGDARYIVQQGDSVLAPRKISHVWAYTGKEDFGKMLVMFHPVGKMESFFRTVSERFHLVSPEDPKLWKEHGMELLGPPLKI